MKRKEFIKIVIEAMEMIENNKEEFSCNAVFFSQKGKDKTVEFDYRKVFGDRGFGTYNIKAGFGIPSFDTETKKQVRLNALSMYLAQSLAFGTYKEL